MRPRQLRHRLDPPLNKMLELPLVAMRITCAPRCVRPIIDGRHELLDRLPLDEILAARISRLAVCHERGSPSASRRPPPWFEVNLDSEAQGIKFGRLMCRQNKGSNYARRSTSQRTQPSRIRSRYSRRTGAELLLGHSLRVQSLLSGARILVTSSTTLLDPQSWNGDLIQCHRILSLRSSVFTSTASTEIPKVAGVSMMLAERAGLDELVDQSRRRDKADGEAFLTSR